MRDREAFIRAIIAAPDDDVPRLIFADYLDENGDQDRAEFIRVQCRLASVVRPHVCGHSFGAAGCWVCHLRRRERKLYETSSDWMLKELPDCIAGFVIDESEFFGSVEGEIVGLGRRGFVEEIFCSWEDWVRHADAIRAATPLKKVRLTTWIHGITGWVEGMLQSQYPGIEFELPVSNQGYSASGDPSPSSDYLFDLAGRLGLQILPVSNPNS